MTFRFEEENFKNLYVLEDYYCTNPFCDCDHVTLSLSDRDDDGNRFSFLLNFNKTLGDLPDHPALTDSQSGIVKEFIKDLNDELLVLFKQRYLEAKAHGEKNPLSFLLFEPGKFVNYMELFPRLRELLDFEYADEKYFAEDFYELDPRIDNKSVKLALYKFDTEGEKHNSVFNYNYFFGEKKREEQDQKLAPEYQEILLALNEFIPNLNEILNKRYKQAKAIGKELLENVVSEEFKDNKKVTRNESCPCGSGKKYKKCCALKPVN